MQTQPEVDAAEVRRRVRPNRAATTPRAQVVSKPAAVAAYVNTAVRDSHDRARGLLAALRAVARQRGIKALAARAELSREALHLILSQRGNPRLSSLDALLEALGLQLTVSVRKKRDTTAVSGNEARDE